MEFDISRFRETFFQEADEHLGEMESGLLQLEGNPDPELLNAVFRGAHSIKSKAPAALSASKTWPVSPTLWKATWTACARAPWPPPRSASGCCSRR
jgi:hypothetical protein